MANYSTAEIRNVALIGHQSCGKTSLADAILHVTGVSNRLGDVNNKTSHLDFMDEEKTRGCSIDSALLHVTVKDKQLNIIDAPGAPDFAGPAIGSLAGVETVACVISASAGIEVNTRRMMDRAKQYGLGRTIVINKIDANLDLDELVAGIQDLFGQECQPFNLPTGKGSKVIDCFTNSSGDTDCGDVAQAHTALIERIVEADEVLMEQYLEAGEIATDKLVGVVGKAIAAGSVVPILFTAARDEVGVRELLDFIADYCPSPLEGKQRVLVEGEKETPIKPDPKGSFIGQVFKVFADPRSNIKYSICRIHSGSVKSDSSIYIGDERKAQRPGQLYKLQGTDHTEIQDGIAGDIVAMAKLDTSIGDLLHAGEGGKIQMPAFPHPMFALAIEPKSRSDADKVSGALAKFTDEDPCFVADRDPGTKKIYRES